MVIWVFAGGGEAELRGLSIFLRSNFKSHIFEMQTPFRQKPGPRPNKYHALGQTGSSLRRQIKVSLEQALRGGRCDRILVLDDLDCHDIEQCRQAFEITLQTIAGAETIEHIIAFAAPEIEAWLIADWARSFANWREFRPYQVQIRRALAEAYRESTAEGDIGQPENFSWRDTDRNACAQKLSEKIQDVVQRIAGSQYSKDEHSGSLLQQVRADVIQQSCPTFRRTLYAPLNAPD